MRLEYLCVFSGNHIDSINVIDSLKTSTGVDFTGHITGGNQSKQDLIDSLGLGPSGPSGSGGNPTTVYQKYDDSALKALLASLQGEFTSLKDAYNKSYRKVEDYTEFGVDQRSFSKDLN